MSSTRAKHTLGPWKIGARIDSDNTLPIETGIGTPTTVAYVAPRPFYADDQEANARLIAVSPQLVDALVEAVDQIKYLHIKLSPKMQQFTAPTTATALATARTILVKAGVLDA